MESITLCPECKYYMSIEDGPRTGIWYNLYCSAISREPTIDPTTGKRVYKGTNDLGGDYTTDTPYYHCRDINDGNCKHFRPKTCKKCDKCDDVFDKIKKYLGE